MKHTEFPSISDASLTPVISRPKPNSSRGYFVYLVDALHASRRLQAARVIRQHRHLIHEERGQAGGQKVETKSGEDQTARIAPETEPDAGRPGVAMSARAMLLMAIVIAGFGILHTIADGALRHAAAPQPTEDSAPLSNRD
jgi:hypothetical protein